MVKINNIMLGLIVLSFAGAVWLITENNRLKLREVELIDMVLDLEIENSRLQKNNIMLVEENVLWKSCCALSNMEDE